MQTDANLVPVEDHTLVSPSREARLPELDSLRGLAAVSVVLLHFHDMWTPDNVHALSPAMHIVLLVLKPLYSGTEAVMLFFLLSGVVLSLPFLRGKHQPYSRFALRRTIRIYGPYVVAITIAIIGAELLQARMPHMNTFSSNQWREPFSSRLIAAHYLFLGSYDTSKFDPVIWTLIHGLRISLVFPLLFYMARRVGSLWSLAYAFSASIVAAAALPHVVPQSTASSLLETLHFSSFFVIGILFASHRDELNNIWNVLSRQWKVAFLGASILLFSYNYRAVGLIAAAVSHEAVVTLSARQVIISNWLSLIASVGLIAVTMWSRSVRQFMSTPLLHLLGRSSYSLYLTHALVLFTITAMLGTILPVWEQFALYLVTTPVLGWCFCVCVEEPLIRLARSI